MRLVPFLLLAGLLAWAANSPRPDPKAAGSPSAPIRIEVFSDFECPACKTLHDQTLPELLRDYVATGKVYLIHREFPLPQHVYSRLAAAYATAAARVGKYQDVSDRLFLYQASWSASGGVDATACRGLTSAEAKTVRALVIDPSIAAEIERDVALGQKIPIRQTPTMLIKHGSTVFPWAGAVNYELLRSYLDSELAK
ncbi:MAG: thioredoxin domain-containing protein [Bryobacteraceae bacterium]|jgi:protein-disulfide isomerase